MVYFSDGQITRYIIVRNLFSIEHEKLGILYKESQ